MPPAPWLTSALLAGAGVLLAVHEARAWARGPAPPSPYASTVRAAVACLLVSAALFPETWTRGWVLSQAGLAEGLWPWAAAPTAPAPGAWNNPLLGDAVWWGYPWLVAVTEALRDGRLPLWSAASYAGHPLAASYLPAVYSPFTAIAAIVPLPWATVAIAIARLVVGGTGMFAWLRAMGVGAPAALVGGLACALNPFSLVWLEDPSASVVACTPWMLTAAWFAIVRGARRDVVALAACTALVLLAGNPQTAFNVGLLAAVFVAAGVAARPGTRQRLAAAARVAAGVAAGVALSAVQLVPFFEYMGESRVYAARSVEAVNRTFVARRTVVTALVPGFFGHPSGPTVAVVNRFGQPTNYVEQIAYPGAVLWPLAAVGLVAGRRRWPVVAVAVAGVVGAALKYGAPGVLQAASALPLLRVTPLGRFGVVVVISAIVLAAIGLDRLVGPPRARERDQARARPARLAWVAAAVAGAAVAMLALALWRERVVLTGAGLWHPVVVQSAIAAALVGGAALVVAARERHWIGPPAVVAAIALLLVADLVALGRGFRPLVPADRVFPPVAAIDAVRRDPDLFRVAGWGSALLPNAHVVYGLQQFRGYDSMNQRRYSALIDEAIGPEVRLHEDRPFADGPIWDLLNVKYVFVRPEVVMPSRFEAVPGVAGLYCNRTVLPRAFLVDRIVPMPEAAALRAVARGDIDLRTAAIASDDGALGASTSEADGPPGRAEVVHYRDEFVEVRTEAPGRRWLVLGDLYYPGWRATVDGTPVPVHRVNVAFRGVEVPPGRHVVRFDYRPMSFAIGAAVSALTALVLCVAWWYPRTRRA